MIVKTAAATQGIPYALALECELDQRMHVVKAYRGPFSVPAYIPCVSERDAWLMASDMRRIEKWHHCVILRHVDGLEYVELSFDGDPL